MNETIVIRSLPGTLPRGAVPIGRNGEIRAVTELFGDRRRLVLHGPSGIGKTVLAVAAAARVRERGLVEGAVYLSFAAGADAAWTLDAMALALVGPEVLDLPRERRMAAVLKAASSRATVIIWDHVDRVLEAPWGGEPASLRAILEIGVELTQAGGTRLIVVGRQGDLDYVPYQPSRRCEIVAVGPLSPAGAAELASALGASGLPSARALAAAAGNPLALRLLLADEPAPVAVPPAPDPVQAALEGHWAGLDGPGRARLSALAPVVDGASEQVLRAVVAEPAERCRSLIRALQVRGLTSDHPIPDADPYISFHHSLHRFLGQHAEPGARAEAEERHRRVYLDLGYRWSGGGPASHAALALREMPNLIMAFARSLDRDQDQAAALADALQESLGPPLPGTPTVIDRVLAAADAFGVRVGRAAAGGG